VKIGIEIGEFSWQGGTVGMADTLLRVARSADDAGISLIGVGDHLWQGPHAGGPEQPELECFATLAFIAGHTRHCRLGPVVAGVHFRSPALLAKTVTTLDVLTGGRAVLGIGVGWNEEEAHGMGIAFPSLAERFSMLEETLQICHRLWQGTRGDERPFTGRHYELGRPLNSPQNLASPHPPILIGGGGDKTLRLVARYGDACNLYPGPDLTDKLAKLRQYCAEEGRDYDSIEKTCIFPLDMADGNGSVGEVVTSLRDLAAVGVETAICILTGDDPVRSVEIIGDKVVPAVDDV
jgi:F420-dependent oxidoreductase-like protein